MDSHKKPVQIERDCAKISSDCLFSMFFSLFLAPQLLSLISSHSLMLKKMRSTFKIYEEEKINDMLFLRYR